jgi:ATP-dependent Clp protease adaptor protein ClpS
MAEIKHEGDIAVVEKISMAPPRMWKVILHNDDVTTMEFVVLVLMQIFHKSFEEAQDIMMTIHEQGKGVVGIYSFEVAATKREDTHTAARTHKFPLRADIEPDE